MGMCVSEQLIQDIVEEEGREVEGRKGRMYEGEEG